MKRIFSFVCVVALIVFTACEDVPAPYSINSNGGNSKTIFSETFASSLGKFTNFTTSGDVAWTNSYSCATATGYNSSTKTTSDGTAYLVSPSIDLTETDSAYVTYDYILRYVRNQTYQKLVITEDFTPNASNIETQIWEDLVATHTEGADYTTFSNAAVSIPEKYMGKKIRLALYFKCETSSSTWEVKNFKVINGVPEGNVNPEPSSNSIPYTSTSLSDFTVKTLKGTAWSPGSSYSKATGYDSENKTYIPTETWLVSPAINTTIDNDNAVYVDFDYVIRYLQAGTDIKANHKVKISTDYSGDVSTATWTDLNFNAKESATQDWTFYAAESMQIPAAFINQEKVYIALIFECGSSNSTTWELKNFNIHQSNGGGDDPTPSGDNLIANGDFETWNNGIPPCWKSATTASSGTLSQSNDAHGGSFSVQVEGSTAANKRIAYEEIKLKAGTYNLKFYAKAATSTGGSVRPGYTPVTDGAVGSYVYGEYVNNLTNSDWVEVNHNFTLSAETTLNLVIMISKSPGGSVLIDDAELTTDDGGLADGGSDNENNDNATIPYNITFTNSITGWSVADKSLGNLSYVWKQNTTYGMKASAYVNTTNNAAESWLVSPDFTIPASGATLTVNHAINYLNGNNAENFLTVNVITSDAVSHQLTMSQWPDGASFNYIDATASLSLYAGQTVQIAFKYASTALVAPTWEIKSLSIK